MAGSRPAEADDDEIDLRELLTQLLARKWFLAGALAAGGLLGGGYAQLAPNEWQSKALIQIEERSSGVQLPTELIGELMGNLGEPESRFETEAHVIRSGLILNPVIAELGLATRVTPAQLPLVGDTFLRLELHRMFPYLDGLMPARFPRAEERVEVARFGVVEELLGTPVPLEVLVAGRFAVTLEGERYLGEVGTALNLGGRGSLLVSEIAAAPGRQFVVRKLPERVVRQGVASRLVIQERGGRQATGIVDFAYTSPDPELSRQILATVIRTYQEANIRRRSVELDQSIEFIESQLPEVQAELEASVERLASFRQEQDAQELSLGTQMILEQSVALETRLEELDFQMEDLLDRVTPNHPDFRALAAERERVAQRFANIQQDLQMVPEAEQTLARLTERVERARELEQQLVERAEQLQILRASTVGTIRMLEPAQMAELVGPSRVRPAALGAVLALFLAMVFVLARNMLRTGVEDARDVESLGLSLFATVGLDTQGKGKRTTDAYRMVATDSDNPVSEAFRGLRTGLQFSMAVANSNVLMVTSCAPGEGKSFTSSNLAMAAAIGGARVLLIDADLRRGKIHRPYNLRKSMPGFTQALAKEVTFETVCYKTDIDNLTFVPTGPKPPNPAELLSSPMFTQILDSVKDAYDLIMLDAPPVLSVSDPLVMGQHAGITMLVVRHLVTTQAEIQSAIKSLEAVNIQISGAILNQFDARKSRYGQYSQKYGYQYGGYRYAYTKDKSED